MKKNDIFQSLVAKIMKGSTYQELLKEAKDKDDTQTFIALVDNKTKFVEDESETKEISK